MKTISELNSKTWYRFLKVLFVAVFLVIFVGFNCWLVFGEGFRSVDGSKTKILCNYEAKKTFTAKSIGLSFGRGDFKNEAFDYKYFFEWYNDYEIKKILKECFDEITIQDYKLEKTEDIFAIQRWYELGLQEKTFKPLEELKEIWAIENAILDTDKEKYLDYSIKLFDIIPVFNYNNFLKFLLLGNLAIFAAFELSKRLFYYVVLGTLRPKKIARTSN